MFIFGLINAEKVNTVVGFLFRQFHMGGVSAGKLTMPCFCIKLLSLHERLLHLYIFHGIGLSLMYFYLQMLLIFSSCVLPLWWLALLLGN